MAPAPNEQPVGAVGIGVAIVGLMKLLFPSSGLRLIQASLLAFGLLALQGCSKTDVNLTAQPSPPPTVVVDNQPPQKTAADRLVEIDRLLALPPTGRPEDSDRRTALRAEREALITSGQVPYRVLPQNSANRTAANPPNNTVTRASNGNVVHYAAPVTPTEPITVAPNSQAKNLSFLEQMTPTERENYYKTIKLQNTRRVEVDVRRH
jgi:hypothetical protein